MNLLHSTEQVAEFMRLAGQDVPEAFGYPDNSVIQLRCTLHEEEFVNEFRDGFQANDLVLVADSLADSLVVLLGTFCAFGARPIDQNIFPKCVKPVLDSKYITRIAVHEACAFTWSKYATRREEPSLVIALLKECVTTCFITCDLLGIDITPVFNEVMDSNMTKFIDGHRREDGKWIKGPSHRPADIRSILVSQGAKL